ncbi:L-threonylcarbamoyladenylate synthase [Ichthyobacterium seriolicida]|uniref:L-threonylcarbamoyladenylate synthase n=1 Tax=Ichthyobacterium seriolicida TaxID=242600 RepID=A0A1J1DYJ5_9FLAO|nr:L-threonylcarbamoyladenylate synthase [Ichthyobacterium seriolicida]BAV94975.1 translation factor Sua5 [Ichthyobacterium seriolicida]
MIKELSKTVEVLKRGGVVLYPTDTIWGLGCDAKNESAIDRIYDVKKRLYAKSMIILVNSEQMLKKIVDIPKAALEIINDRKKIVTIIYDNPRGIPKSIVSKDNTIAIRLTRNTFCNRLISMLNSPIVSTSANISGFAHPNSFKDIDSEILNQVDYCVNLYRDNKCIKPSSIIRVSENAEIKIIRE